MKRRDALGLLGAAAAAGAAKLVGCTRPAEVTTMATTSLAAGGPKLPAVYLPHGGGPWPFVDLGWGKAGGMGRLGDYLRQLGMRLPEAARSVLVISAHWEEPVPTVMTAERPPMLYDYYGFPQAAYEVQWPAPGQPELAARVRELLSAAGFSSAADGKRGFDHGTFVVTKLIYPQADVPTIQLSLKRGLDPAEHVRIGRALAPLRSAGVFLIGSGMSYHNMRGFRAIMQGRFQDRVYDESKAFDDWLAESMTLDASRRESRLAEWDRAPAARACHPREEHLLPLMVCAGAAEDDAATLPYREQIMGAHVSAVHFGDRA